MLRRAFSVVAAGFLIVGATEIPAETQYGPEDFSSAYEAHVANQVAATRSFVSQRMGLLMERSEELHEEVGIRSDIALSQLPSSFRGSFSRQPQPLPASLQKINEFDEILASEVYEIQYQVDEDLSRIVALQDSLEYGLKSPEAVSALVAELRKNIETNIDLWGTRIDVIRQQLIRDGTPDQARRMFAREYNAIALRYQTGRFESVLSRLDVLTKPYGDIPLDEWLEGLPFFRAEALFALGRWDEAFAAYERSWQDQRTPYAPQAYLNWIEMAFASAKHGQIAAAWSVQPKLPGNMLDRNRIRILVAETYLKLDDPRSALAVLGSFETELNFTDEELADLDAFTLEQMQAANHRLVLYSRLLAAEANAYGAFMGAAAPYAARSTTAPADVKATEGDDFTHDLTAALTELGEMGRDTPRDPIARTGDRAYQVAAGMITPERRDYTQLDRLIARLEQLVPEVQRIEANGPLFARVVMPLGAAYFERGRYTDAVAAFSAVPITSAWHPEALIWRAWAEMELGDGLGAMHSLALAQRWRLSPSLSIEAAALNAYLLEDMGQIEQADDQLRRMLAAVTIEERRIVSSDVAAEIASLESRLRLVTLIALEKQQRSLYQDAIAQRVKLDSLMTVHREVERLLQRYASGIIDEVTVMRSTMDTERSLLNSIGRAASTLRQRAGDIRGADIAADLTYQERHERLRGWIEGLRPEEIRQIDSVYRQWADYAEFAYSKRPFEENLKRKTRSAALKEERSRINRLLQETP